MTREDLTYCEFIDQYLRFVLYDDFCQNCKAIKAYFNKLDNAGKRFYKWYVYANVFIDEQRKNLIWQFLNCDDVNVYEQLLRRYHRKKQYLLSYLQKYDKMGVRLEEIMQIIYKKIDDVIPYENNPRKNDEAVDYVAKSIKEFGFKVPIIIDKNGVIVTGHTRLKAAKKLGMDEVPVILADDLTEEQIKAFRLADNKVAEFADWDDELLKMELDDIDIDMSDFGFVFGEIGIEGGNPLTDEKYTTKVEIPQYEITGEEPPIEELVDLTKTNELIAKIEKSNVSDEQKKFLIEAAKRHSVFNYSKIAEYYAHQDKEMQELMEDSALIIIDFDDAIKNGYVQLRSEILGLEEQDYEDNEE